MGLFNRPMPVAEAFRIYRNVCSAIGAWIIMPHIHRGRTYRDAFEDAFTFVWQREMSDPRNGRLVNKAGETLDEQLPGLTSVMHTSLIEYLEANGPTPGYWDSSWDTMIAEYERLQRWA